VAADLLGDREDVLQVGRAIVIRRRADRDEDDVGGGDGRRNVRGEGQSLLLDVPFDVVVQTGLIDRQLEVRAVPSIDTGLVQVDDGNFDVRKFEGDDSTCWTT